VYAGEVSIPQSEFCPLGRVQLKVYIVGHIEFQFLSRNSVRWDPLLILLRIHSFRSFNSSVGILSVGTCIRCNYDVGCNGSFNSSVGILSVGTS